MAPLSDAKSTAGLSDPAAPLAAPQHAEPTVAETGVPILSGTNGPASGQLPPRRPSASNPIPMSHTINTDSAPAVPLSKDEEHRQAVEANAAKYMQGQGSSLGRSDTTASAYPGAGATDEVLPAYAAPGTQPK